MAKRVTTIFVSDDAVNLLQTEGKLVRKWASLPLEPGLVNQGLILDEEKVAEKLSKLTKLTKLGTQRVVIGLSGLNSMYRLVSLPEVPDSILPEAVKHEARRVIPVPLEEVYLCYQRLPGKPGETRIFIAAFPRNVADVLVKTLHKAGLQPYVMDLAPLALCRTLDEPRAIIVNSRLDHLDIVIMDERIPKLIHRLALPGEVSSASARIAAISEEVDRTINFYNSSHTEAPLDATVPMFVCSDLDHSPEGWQMLGARLGCPVSVLPSPVESPDGFNPSDFMVNIGLALKELRYERERPNVSLVNFNALPEPYRPKGISLRGILVRVGIGIAIGLVVCLGYLVKSRSDFNANLRAQLVPLQSSVNLQIKEIKALEAQIKETQAQLGPLEAKAQTFNTTLASLEEARQKVSSDLSQAVSLKPAYITLTRINHNGESIKIYGTARAREDISNYAQALQAGLGGTVSFSYKALETVSYFAGFEFEISVDRG